MKTNVQKSIAWRTRCFARAAVMFSLVLGALSCSKKSASGPENKTKVSESSEVKYVAHPRAAMKIWYDAPATELVNFGPKFAKLVIREQPTSDSIRLSQLQKENTLPELRRLLTMMTAPDFTTFSEALGRSVDNQYTLSESGVIYVGNVLGKTISGLKETSSDLSFLEDYWVIKSRLGLASKYFSGIAVDSSFYKYSSLAEVPPMPFDPFPEDSAAGYDGSASMFVYNGAAPTDEINAGNRLSIVDFRLLMKTRDEGVAYPIAIRLWWSTRHATWIPWFLVEYNRVDRKVGLVF